MYDNTTYMQRRFIYITMVLACITAGALAQQTRVYTDPLANFKQAKEFFQKEQYSLAYPLFKELRNGMRSTDRSNNSIAYDDVHFYTIACGLQQNEVFAAEDAKNFMLNMQESFLTLSGG